METKFEWRQKQVTGCSGTRWGWYSSNRRENAYWKWRINNNKIILRHSLSQARLWKKEGHKLSQRLRKCVRKKQALCDPISIATSSQTNWKVGQLPQHILKSNISKAKLCWMSNKRKNNNFLWEFSSFFVILMSLVLYYIEMLRKSKKMKTVIISYRQYVTWLLPGFLASTATQSLKGRKIGNKQSPCHMKELMIGKGGGTSSFILNGCRPL